MARRDGRPAANRDAKGVRCISLASRDVAGREELFVNHPKWMAWSATKLGVELQVELERFRSPPN
jgi:hypothetical protein